MGTIQPEYLIINLCMLNDTKKIDKFISKLKPEFKNLFFRCNTHTNNEIIYFMSWDGSKEGWDVSEKANEIRDKFIQLIKQEDEHATILKVIPDGEIQEGDIIERP